MTREEVNRLRILRSEIESNTRKLREFEKKEQSAAQYGQSLLRSLRRSDSADRSETIKAELTQRITANQEKYLAVRADLEDKISRIPDHYLRVVLSLVYVDGLTAQEAASIIQGSCTGGGIIQLLVRYFEES